MHIGLASLSKAESPREPKSRGVRKWSLGAWNGRAVGAISISAIFLPFLGLTSSMSRIEQLIEAEFSPLMQGLTEGVSMVLFLFTFAAVFYLIARFWLEWQTVIFDDRTLTIEYAVFGRTRRKRYLRRYVSELHVASDVPEDVKSFGLDSAGAGTFAFRYGIQTVRFGPDRLKHEAEKNSERFSRSRPIWPSPRRFPVLTMKMRPSGIATRSASRRWSIGSPLNSAVTTFESRFHSVRVGSRASCRSCFCPIGARWRALPSRPCGCAFKICQPNCPKASARQI